MMIIEEANWRGKAVVDTEGSAETWLFHGVLYDKSA